MYLFFFFFDLVCDANAVRHCREVVLSWHARVPPEGSLWAGTRHVCLGAAHGAVSLGACVLAGCRSGVLGEQDGG